jgi:hypothetical protein
MKRPLLLVATLLSVTAAPTDRALSQPADPGDKVIRVRDCVAAFQQPEYLLFGGKGHKTFLGCVNCDVSDPRSIFNETGQYGGSLASDNRIWSKFSDFGSPYADLSPWNKFATDPPVIVDKLGRSYGRFTVGGLVTDRTKVPEILRILRASELGHDR